MKRVTEKLKKMQTVGIVLLCISLLTFGIVLYSNSVKRQVPIIFSQKELLDNLWQKYKAEYLEPGSNRTLDKQQNNITTSEGQSYTLLRSVWMGDRETFDATLKWTEDILKHDDSNLHAWLFGESTNGRYQILSERGGQNSASDAESDIALALIFAYAKWDNEDYLNLAHAILDDMWEREVVEVNGSPVLAANDLERFSEDKIIVNPSYFSPYAYRIFAEIDGEHDWLALVDSSYDILKRSAALNLDKSSTVGLPPDWIEIDRQSGEIMVPSSPNLTTNYSYDAMRIPWRVSLDYIWYKEPRAKEFLDTLSFFSTEWQTKRLINTAYTHDGSIYHAHESPAMYGGLIGYFMVSNTDDAKSVYEEKLQILYNPDNNAWKKTLGYYDDNWAWFGIALYENQLPNIAEILNTDE